MTLKDFLNNGDVFARNMGASITEIREGYARAEMVVTKEHLNAGGVCQGGALFTLADLVFFVSITIVVLIWTVIIIEKRRWSRA